MWCKIEIRNRNRLTISCDFLFLCPGQDSNLHERNCSLPPQSSVSTNFTTWASHSRMNLSSFGSANIKHLSQSAKFFHRNCRMDKVVRSSPCGEHPLSQGHFIEQIAGPADSLDDEQHITDVDGDVPANRRIERNVAHRRTPCPVEVDADQLAATVQHRRTGIAARRIDIRDKRSARQKAPTIRR